MSRQVVLSLLVFTLHAAGFAIASYPPWRQVSGNWFDVDAYDEDDIVAINMAKKELYRVSIKDGTPATTLLAGKNKLLSVTSSGNYTFVTYDHGGEANVAWLSDSQLIEWDPTNRPSVQDFSIGYDLESFMAIVTDNSDGVTSCLIGDGQNIQDSRFSYTNVSFSYRSVACDKGYCYVIGMGYRIQAFQIIKDASGACKVRITVFNTFVTMVDVGRQGHIFAVVVNKGLCLLDLGPNQEHRCITDHPYWTLKTVDRLAVDSTRVFVIIGNQMYFTNFWSEWESWSFCDGGQKVRRRKCMVRGVETYDCDSGGHEHVVTCDDGEPFDGSWSEWLPWEDCDKSCGPGVIVRRRYCNNPGPRNGGLDCDGVSTESATCLLTNCSGLFLAAPGQQCTDACRERGLHCSGNLQTGNKADAFSKVGVTCVADRMRKLWQNPMEPAYLIGNSSCVGFMGLPERLNCTVDGFNDVDVRRICNCVNADELEYSEWMPWSECTLSCGGGTQSRYRDCNLPEGQACKGNWIMSRTCNRQKCPVDGEWQPWSSQSECSRPCNTGTKARWRVCDPMPLYGGLPCQGDSYEEEPCNPQLCATPYSVIVSFRILNRRWDESMKLPVSPSFSKLAAEVLVAILESYMYVEDSRFLAAKLVSALPGSVIVNISLDFLNLESYQLLALQDDIGDDGWVSDLQIDPLSVMFYATSVPQAPPQNVEATIVTDSMIKVLWEEVPLAARNGDVLGYVILYREKLDPSATYSSIGSRDLGAEIHGLKMNTIYVIKVTAYTAFGNGVASKAIEQRTLVKGPILVPLNVTASATSSREILVTWERVSQADSDAVINGYVISYFPLAYPSDLLEVRVRATGAQVILEDLQANTTFVIDVALEAGGILGPPIRVGATTLPQAPTQAPEEFTVSDLQSTKELIASWQPINLTSFEGDFLGYELIVTLLFRGKTATSETETFILHPRQTNFTYRAESGCKYEFELAAINEHGVGPYSGPVAAETCRCPPILYTNYYLTKPYVFRQEPASDLAGLYEALTNDMVIRACGSCRNGHGLSQLDYNNNGKGKWSEKRTLGQCVRDIDHLVHLSYPLPGNPLSDIYMSRFGFATLVESPGIAFIVIRESLWQQALVILIALRDTWPIYVVNMAMCVVAGMVMWFLEAGPNEKHFKRVWYTGLFAGIWWAFVTQGTLGYGDKYPVSIRGRVLCMVWLLVGLVSNALLMSTVAGAFLKDTVKTSVQIYGTRVACVVNTTEYRFGIMRKAIVNPDRNFTSLDEVYQAVMQREVQGALVESNIVASRSDLFNNPELTVVALIPYPLGSGYVTSGEARYLRDFLQDEIDARTNEITLLLRNLTGFLEPAEIKRIANPLFNPESPLFWTMCYMFGGLTLFAAACGLSVRSIITCIKKWKKPSYKELLLRWHENLVREPFKELRKDLKEIIVTMELKCSVHTREQQALKKLQRASLPVTKTSMKVKDISTWLSKKP